MIGPRMQVAALPLPSLPAGAETKLNEAQALQQQSRHEQAAELVRQVYEQNPDHPIAQRQMGIAFLALERPEAALALLSKAQTVLENDLCTLHYLGHACILLGEDTLGAQWLTAALHHPALPWYDMRVWLLMAASDAFWRMGRHADAERCDRLLMREPTTSPHIRHTQGLRHLRYGEYRAGWQLNEGRCDTLEWQVKHEKQLRAAPQWDGGTPGVIAYFGEQGLGDALQMMRYVPILAERTGHLVPCWVSPALKPLFADLPGAGEVRGYNEPPPACDAAVMAMSAPLLLGTAGLASVPPPVISPRWQWERWPAYSSHESRPRIGLAWRGSDYSKYTADRSIHDPDTTLRPLFTGPLADVEWVSLQQDVDPPAGAPFARAHFRDFAETADLLLTLDAVVTVDTSVVHLAGTMGVPTWLFPPVSPEWRWGLRDRTPWYPSVRLVRRHRARGWPDAVGRVTTDLLVHLEGAAAAPSFVQAA